MASTPITHDPEAAGLCLKQGGVVVFPTETVFGIGASAFDHRACQRLYAIKRRPADNPLIIHLSAIDQIQTIALLPKHAFPIVQTFCPGPLTLILKKNHPSLFTAHLDTVAIRIPQSALARAMIDAAEAPIAAPSANLSGKPSITRFQDAVEQFDGHVDMILQGPPSTIGLESTVIDLSGPIPIYLRPGAIAYEALLPFLPDLKRLADTEAIDNPLSPGLKYRHYSPACQVILMEELSLIDPRESGQIGFELHHQSAYDLRVSSNEEYSHALYAFFIDCDRKGLKRIYCQHPKPNRLAVALLNRLQKAAAF